MSAKALIDRLRLQPHPESGWYRETVRAQAADGGRGAGVGGNYSNDFKYVVILGRALALTRAPGDLEPRSVLRTAVSDHLGPGFSLREPQDDGIGGVSDE